ncbi:MAG: mechanosensitive ion channel family protein [Prevotella sp.]
MKENTFFRRIITIALMLLAFVADSSAVLKEENLEKTLSILRTELNTQYREQAARLAMQKRRSDEVRSRIMEVWQKSNQNALMLYSQKQDYVFDLTYACHEATQQYQDFTRVRVPFVSFLNRTKLDIARYDSLSRSLRDMPDIMLSEKARADRDECIRLSTAILKQLRENYKNTNDFIRIYNRTAAHLREINDYANKRYNDIQTDIFKNGSDGYFTVLKRLRFVMMQMQQTVEDKYKARPLSNSQWDSKLIFGLFVVIFFYGIVASLLNILVIKRLLPRRIREKDFLKRPSYFIMASTTFTFAIILAVIRATTNQNFVIMASDLLVEYAWLLGIILFSLLLRLSHDHMKAAFRIYAPLVAVGFIVISFRIILIPNELVNLIFPPILLVSSIWQWLMIRRYHHSVPRVDMFYSYCSLLVFIFSVVSSWSGYTLMSVQVLIWWIMQLTCILTIASLSRWMKIVGKRKRIDQRPITATWFYHFCNQAVLPIMGVSSVMLSIYWAADVFNLSVLCWKIFTTNFVQLDNLKFSIIRLSTAVSLWFVFSYICTTLRSLLRLQFERQDPTTAASREMMGKNVLQVVVWGAWFLIVLSIFDISFAWLMVVTGGLSTGIGFASKDILENIYYGISLMTGRIKVGDLIECDGIRGKVTSISYVSTLIESTDGSVIAFQNSQLFTKNYKNLTRNHGYALSAIVFGVGYGTNIKDASKIVEDAVSALNHPYIDSAKPVKVVFLDFGDSSINLKLLCWVDVLKQAFTEGDIRNCIYDTLNRNNIEMPFPKRDVYVKEVAKQ